jgi:uncharacterized protein (TIGR03435 family)
VPFWSCFGTGLRDRRKRTTPTRLWSFVVPTRPLWVPGRPLLIPGCSFISFSERPCWRRCAAYILDDTGLTGGYDFTFEYPLGPFGLGRGLEYASGAVNFTERELDVSWKNIVRFQTATDIKPDFAVRAREALTEQPESDPALIAAIKKQLGVKLVKSKIPLDVVIVDHIEKIPVEN